MEFTINAKELSTLLDKAITGINKKGIVSLTRVYLEVTGDGILKVLGTNLEHWIEVETTDIDDYVPGVVGIDNEDIKNITKMKGVIKIENNIEKQRLSIVCGKKKFTLPSHENTDLFLPYMDNTEEEELILEENWLLETLTNFYGFTEKESSNKLLETFHFNLHDLRVEALEGRRIAIRDIPSELIKGKSNILVHNMCVPVLKKVMSKKSKEDVSISQDQKYVKFKGKDFTYIVRKIEGRYFDVNKMLSDKSSFSFIASRENLLQTMKYNMDLSKNEPRTPIILHAENGSLFSYLHTSRYENFDEIETENLCMSNKLYIGFNPGFLFDVLSIVDSDKPRFRGSKADAPLFVDGEEYHFLVLPVKLNGSIGVEYMKEEFKKEKTA